MRAQPALSALSPAQGTETSAVHSWVIWVRSVSVHNEKWLFWLHRNETSENLEISHPSDFCCQSLQIGQRGSIIVWGFLLEHCQYLFVFTLPLFILIVLLAERKSPPHCSVSKESDSPGILLGRLFCPSAASVVSSHPIIQQKMQCYSFTVIRYHESDLIMNIFLA